METFTENASEQLMEEIASAANEVLVSADTPEKFGKQLEVIVRDLDKPELSDDARKHLNELVAMVRQKLDQSQNYADVDIEAVLRALLMSGHSQE